MNFLGSLGLVWEQKNRHVSRARSTNCFGCSAAWSTAEAVRNLVKNVAADWSGVGASGVVVWVLLFFIADLIICGPQKVVAALSCSSSGSKSAQGAQKVVASCLLPLPQCLIWGQFKCVQKEPDVGQQSLALVNPTGLPSKLDSSNHPYMGLLERVGPQIQWLIVMFPLKLGNLMWYIPNLRHTQMSYQLGCTQL